ncbi:MAG: LarC family nickel insertion protein [Candidatus Gastranaerophilales bacterium]|nr:LarC family nickel insertion protein [Candidatus Gastranaerophilales bacterium]
MKLYFECTNGISGDMTIGALLSLGADREKLDRALSSLKLDDEFSYFISDKKVNSINAVDFDVTCKKDEHHHHKHLHNKPHTHRNLEDVINIINKADISENAKILARKIFTIVAQAESKVHGLPVEKVHFHEVGAIDSIVDIVAFSVLYDDINPDSVFFTALTEGKGTISCAHGELNVPVPAVVEIAKEYKIPLRIIDNEGEMITPTGIAIVASLYKNNKLPESIIIKNAGYGRGKRPYKNPVLRIFEIE